MCRLMPVIRPHRGPGYRGARRGKGVLTLIDIRNLAIGRTLIGVPDLRRERGYALAVPSLS